MPVSFCAYLKLAKFLCRAKGKRCNSRYNNIVFRKKHGYSTKPAYNAFCLLSESTEGFGIDARYKELADRVSGWCGGGGVAHWRKRVANRVVGIMGDGAGDGSVS